MLERGRRAWKMEDIDFGAIRKNEVQGNEQLFYLLASSSFVEILSELYTSNLIEHYRGNGEAERWLRETWVREEVQHGQALKRYVQTVWPEFDWEGSYSGFAEEYAGLCSLDNLEASRALEMAARCVVETGTSTLYRCLHDAVEEPVLKQILANIKADEVRHYAMFRRLFMEHNRTEGKGALAVLLTIAKRALEIRGEDGYIAFKHAYSGRSVNRGQLDQEWRRFRLGLKSLMTAHYPFDMAVEMLLSPVPLARTLKHRLEAMLIRSARFFVARGARITSGTARV